MDKKAAHVLEFCSVSMTLHQDHFKSQVKQFHFKANRTSVAEFRNSTSKTLPLRKMMKKKRMKMMKTFHHSDHQLLHLHQFWLLNNLRLQSIANLTNLQSSGVGKLSDSRNQYLERKKNRQKRKNRWDWRAESCTTTKANNSQRIRKNQFTKEQLQLFRLQKREYVHFNNSLKILNLWFDWQRIVEICFSKIPFNWCSRFFFLMLPFLIKVLRWLFHSWVTTSSKLSASTTTRRSFSHLILSSRSHHHHFFKTMHLTQEWRLLRSQIFERKRSCELCLSHSLGSPPWSLPSLFLHELPPVGLPSLGTFAWLSYNSYRTHFPSSFLLYWIA
jgi:hypothetical protein